MFKVIDTHTHLDAEEFDEDRAEAFARAREAGVGKVFLPAIDVKTTHAVLALSREYPGYAYPMIGLHPEEVKEDWKEQLAELRKMQFSDFIAIGEIGLDYYWSREFEHEQLQAFGQSLKGELVPEDPHIEEREMKLQKMKLSANCPFIGKSLSESGIRDVYNCMLVGLEDGQHDLTMINPSRQFKQGDIIWIVGERKSIADLVATN